MTSQIGSKVDFFYKLSLLYSPGKAAISDGIKAERTAWTVSGITVRHTSKYPLKPFVTLRQIKVIQGHRDKTDQI